jgi:hypothetical protein
MEIILQERRTGRNVVIDVRPGRPLNLLSFVAGSARPHASDRH